MLTDKLETFNHELVGRILGRDYKTSNTTHEINCFTLPKSGLVVTLTISRSREDFSVAIGELGLMVESTYKSKKPLELRDLFMAIRDAMKNLEKSRATQTNQTWAKYKNPNR